MRESALFTIFQVEVVEEIESKAQRLHEMIDKYRQQMIDQVVPSVQEEKDKNEAKIREVQGQRQMLEDCTSYLDKLFQHGNPDEILDNRDIIKDRLCELAHLPIEPITGQLNVKFRHGNRTVGANELVYGKVEIYNSPLNDQAIKEISKSFDLNLANVMPSLGETVELVAEFECRGLSDTKDIWPSGITLDITGNMLIVDRGNRRVKMFDRDGKLLREFGNSGTGEVSDLS